MIPFDEAFRIVMDTVRPLGSERVFVSDGVNRILAEDIQSDLDMPPFHKAAMDGYACRRQDLQNPLMVIETIQAGISPTQPIGPSECSKIMTGAMMPEGADCVIMVEYTETVDEQRVRFTGRNTQDNICFRGEDIRAGDLVLRKGDRIGAQHIAVLASVGCVRPLVSCRPRVGVIATGDELVEPDVKPGPSQIRTSNSYQLCAQVALAGGVPSYYGIARDTEKAIDAAFKSAIAANDVILVSGGVSKGDFDLVPNVMAKNNIRILFDSVAMKPGKPTTFGVSPEVYCIGLPGNPVSTFIQFELLVKPFLYALMGHVFRTALFRLPLAETITRKHSDRTAWIPVRITEEGEAIPCSYHGSAHVAALCGADGLIAIPAGDVALEKGTQVHVRSI